jgi:PEP-CTERM motif
MKRRYLVVAWLAGWAQAQAAIAPGTSGDGELFFNVHDPVAKVSYVLDLGIRMDEFFVAAQQEIGFQRFWPVDTPNWTSFLALVSLNELQWSVAAIDSTGNAAAGGQRLFTTVRQGSEGSVGNYTNLNFTNGTGATQAGNFFTGIAGTGTHGNSTDFALNGDSYAAESDSGRGYYGESGGLTPNFNGSAPFGATNSIGQSSWFYYLTRSGTSNLSTARVLVDEFDNLGHDGYWGFIKVQGTDAAALGYNPDSPYVGKYLLSYTLPVYDVRTTAAFRSFAQSIGRTEFSGGMQVGTLPGAARAATLEFAAGWVTPLGLATATRQGLPAPLQLLSPVPEPGTWLLMAGGLGLLLARRRSLLPAR